MSPPAAVAAAGAAALLGASAIGHATGGAAAGGPAVVTVGDGPAAVATGFTAGAGRVVTVAHAAPGPTVTVRGEDGVARRATVLRRDDALDLVLLSVPGLRGPGMPGASSGVRVRRDGGATSLPATVVRRADATVRAGDGRELARRPVLELRAGVRAGDSGAPVLRDGRVTGVVFARSRARGGVAWAVDGTALSALLR